MPKNENDFRLYLKHTPTQQRNKLDEAAINALVKILNENIVNQIRSEYPNINSILDIDELDFLNSLKERLKIGNNLHQFNRNIGNGAPSRALFQYINFLKNDKAIENLETESIEKINNLQNQNTGLNQILYGPPGTGKTYNTINRALEIIDEEVSDDRSEAKKRFESLSEAGQIEFVTFHQSYGYEEFVEGIKANTLDGSISYDVEDGVFKKLAF
ncbi:hypothetical protein JHD47_04380 [Sulfurimonas sp. SAG-AH-194-L11]|nr:hypothetical protein [Sulfurimonas sp. SAG-AH-194-L11]